MSWRCPNLPRWARYDPAIGLSLLFRPLPKTQDRPKLNVVYLQAGRLELRFSAREALGMPEQTLLLAILELAGEKFLRSGGEQVLNGSCIEGIGAMLWSELFPDGPWEGAQTLRFDTTWEELNGCTGNAQGGSANETRRRSLVRLCEVAVWEKCLVTGSTRQSYLVRWLTGDDRRIHLALNPRLTAGFFLEQYATVSMAERLQLRADLPMAIHAFFSTTIRPGHQLHIRPETLAARMWPDNHVSAPAGTIRRRFGDVVRGINAVGGLPKWTVSWAAAGVATIVRHDGQSSRERPAAAVPSIQLAKHAQTLTGASSSDIALSSYDVSGLMT